MSKGLSPGQTRRNPTHEPLQCRLSLGLKRCEHHPAAHHPMVTHLVIRHLPRGACCAGAAPPPSFQARRPSLLRAEALPGHFWKGYGRFLGGRAQAVSCPQILPRDSSSRFPAARARAQRPGRDGLIHAHVDAAHIRLAGHLLLYELVVAWWCRLVRRQRCSSPGPTHGNVHRLGDPDACLHAPPLGGRRCSGPSYSNPGTWPVPRPVFVRRPLARLTPAQRGWACRRSSSRGRAGLRVQASRGRRGRGAMLGKDYMLAIILVNCDGVHGGTRWEGGL